ncbi:MAG TPA: glutamate--tRNA ligase [Cryomorphaceae bacterium]|nr:glutamate--tRNA ligase [Cryomorphaceae bacterium]|tara:strand:- start:7141 stop:8664 length:1524 start_codon:yes stop_codon:yes gene_type:complete
MSSNVRVRFAPSPTGPLHIGGVRTALYNYLFAKKHGGDFLLRIEDTDQTRFVPGAEQYIIEALAWCGISPDEGIGGETIGNGPYRQSERKSLYRKYVDQLLAVDKAYIAFDTSEELNTLRQMAKDAGATNWQYNYITRGNMKNSLTLPKEEVKAKIEAGASYVVRIKLPRDHEVRFEDTIRGWVSVNTNNMDDKVLYKADGMPTYHLANIVDDHLMGITHVIRGEEWLPSAPLHVMLYEAFGWERPVFAHLPLLLKPDGPGKLSKRDGDRLGFPVFPINWSNPETGETASGYRELGFFPSPFVNMLALLGWNPGTEQEVFNLQGLIEAFDLSKVSKSGAKFDFEKGKWFNQQYLRALSESELAVELKKALDKEGLSYNEAHLGKIATMMSERATFPQDLLAEGRYLFIPPATYDEKTRNKRWGKDSAGMLQDLAARFETIPDFTETNIEAAFKGYLAEKELGFGKVGPSFRLALTGRGLGPSMFTICEVLGKQEVLSRIAKAVEILG